MGAYSALSAWPHPSADNHDVRSPDARVSAVGTEISPVWRSSEPLRSCIGLISVDPEDELCVALGIPSGFIMTTFSMSTKVIKFPIIGRVYEISQSSEGWNFRIHSRYTASIFFGGDPAACIGGLSTDPCGLCTQAASTIVNPTAPQPQATICSRGPHGPRL